jgi:hypothetical protein
VAWLRERGCAVQGYWYNPNVHPLVEYQLRLASARALAQIEHLPFEAQDEYGLLPFLERTFALRDAGPARCAECYRFRLDAVAAAAAGLGWPAFSTTLLVSPQQRHDLVAAAGREAAERHGVAFYYQDWRPGYRAGRRRAKEMGLYRQGYCGCVFSEAERFVAGQPPAKG